MSIAPASPVVLIAEDDEDLRLLVSTTLRREGYEVVEAADGAQAIELADQHEPALAVLDINMPHVGGVEVAEHLRAGDGDTTVIFLTAQTRRAELDRMFGTGPAGYIAKPFPLEKLREQVRAALAA
jgi:two-component system, OmpR family, response regulator